ncbi:hypothetical protein [Flammeovirga sp. SubArs3]|uniref:hypothetical protein n=1 Tax=Flammeovirga sp. SubArs3 TaxID=2995316 RepID=UPI00248C4827|nr:hypothetical protein [Flammeovirga sp. SubArs3]
MSFQIANAQVFKFETPKKNEGIQVRTLPNGNKISNWKKVIEKKSKRPTSNDLIADALFVDFGKIDLNSSKSITIKCIAGIESEDIELFYIGDTDLFSIDIGDDQNFWQTNDSTVFHQSPLEDISIKIRPKPIKKGTNQAYMAFRIDKRLVRIAMKSNVTEEVTFHQDTVSINLGLVEADSIGFTDYTFFDLQELPLNFEYSGDANAFQFMVDGDSILADSISQVIPNSDTLTLSIAPIADKLGDHYGAVKLGNNYLQQEITITSRVEKVRGEIFWADTNHLERNIEYLETTLYSPQDTLYAQLSLYNDSDYDTLFDISHYININADDWLDYSLPVTQMLPRSITMIQVPFYPNKTSNLDNDLNATIDILILKDSSTNTQKVNYKPVEKLREELKTNFPSSLTFTSKKDTLEIRIPYLNTGKNAVYPTVKTFMDEIELPSAIQVYYGTPRIKSWRKGYISIYMTPYDSINFHKEKTQTLKYKVYDEVVEADIHIKQKPLSAIIKDYTQEIILGIISVTLLILLIFSPKIYKYGKREYANYLIKANLKKDIFSINRTIGIIQDTSIQSALEQDLNKKKEELSNIT